MFKSDAFSSEIPWSCANRDWKHFIFSMCTFVGFKADWFNVTDTRVSNAVHSSPTDELLFFSLLSIFCNYLTDRKESQTLNILD